MIKPKGGIGAMTRKKEIAYLGPEGTYSHLVAEKRFGRAATLVPLPTILDIFRFVSRHPDRRAIVPMENSSGGAIYETVDLLLAGKPRVYIHEELSLDVRLALLGRKGEKVSALYSHFAPLEHCDPWLRRHLPRARREVTASTAAAAAHVAGERNAAALGSKRLAGMHGLDILHYPVEATVPNITLFFVIGGRKGAVRGASKITLAVRLPNKPGALCSFLETFRNEKVNLSRLISRPIRGCPRQYAFLVDVDGAPGEPNVKGALSRARGKSQEFRTAGAYSVRRMYRS